MLLYIVSSVGAKTKFCVRFIESSISFLLNTDVVQIRETPDKVSSKPPSWSVYDSQTVVENVLVRWWHSRTKKHFGWNVTSSQRRMKFVRRFVVSFSCSQPAAYLCSPSEFVVFCSMWFNVARHRNKPKNIKKEKLNLSGNSLCCYIVLLFPLYNFIFYFIFLCFVLFSHLVPLHECLIQFQIYLKVIPMKSTLSGFSLKKKAKADNLWYSI